MARVLWISDAGRPTGFARATHEIGERLVTRYGHDINVLAIGYEAADPYETSLKLHRSEAGPTHNYLGFDRTVAMVRKVEPEITITLEDPGILLHRLLGNPADRKRELLNAAPIIAYLPIDGVGLPVTFQQLTKLTNIVAMSKFGQDQLPGSKLVYHGIDAETFHPVDAEHPIETTAGLVYSKEECREIWGVHKDAFVVGRVDTNTGRKDWGSAWRTVEAFTKLERNRQVVALFHTKRTNPQGNGMDLPALLSRGWGEYLITDKSDMPVGDVVALMNCFDVGLHTPRGEGFGLTIGEELACGVPIVSTDFSAIPEVVGPGGLLAPGLAWMTNPYGVDQMLANPAALAEHLLNLASDEGKRQDLGTAGRRHVQDSFSWDEAARLMDGFIRGLVEGSREVALVEQPA